MNADHDVGGQNHTGNAQSSSARATHNSPCTGDACVAPAMPGPPGANDGNPGAQAFSFRKSMRLRQFDYTRAGAYFVTICTRNWACLFGHIENDVMQLNEVGRVAHKLWEEIPTHFPQVELDTWVIMPNHVHGIVILGSPGNGGAPPGSHSAGDIFAAPTAVSPSARGVSALPERSGPRCRSIGAVVGSYKSAVTKEVRNFRRGSDGSIWHRNYFDHVIRNEVAMDGIRRYIEENPARWPKDPKNPALRRVGRTMA